ncbi:YceI family protein [Rhodomicrobium lacus]|uniref:YceI family protein n=1 Tax=Rhodomicrobium lacus TaxID=2498452 RepID=UPI000F8EAF9B|nr:YceI family protein [Rhodomicrobium lacus]
MKISRKFLAAAFVALPMLSLQASAQAPAEVAPAAVQEGTYTVEASHTRVLFAVSHMGFSTWYGEFTGVSGKLTLAPASIEKSSLDIRIPTKSVSTSNAKLDGELKAADWFDAAKFPEITFKAKQIERTGDRTAKVTGDLTFHGVTKPVTLDAVFNGAGTNPINKQYTVGFEATGAIKRSDFGVKTYVPLIGDDVKIIISAAFERNGGAGL